MKRILIGLAATLGGWLISAGPASADFMWVRLNVSQIPKVFANILNPAAGMMGGGPGMMGGGPGMMGGGPGMMGGGPGIMGGGPGIMGGGPGIMGGGPGMMGGGPGMMGGSGPGFLGGGMPGDPMTEPAKSEDIWVNICLETRGKPRSVAGVQYLGAMDLEQHWGQKSAAIPFYMPLFQKGSPLFQLFEIQPTGHKADPLSQDFTKRLKRAKDTKKDFELLSVANWALRHGLLKQFHAAMDELGAAHPADATFKAYVKLRGDLKKSNQTQDPALKEVLGDLTREHYRAFVRNDEDPGHYVIYSQLKSHPATDAILRRRLLRLEESYETFFYWFLMQKTNFQPQLPKYQLVAVLAKDRDDFLNRHVYWGEPPMAEDGFTPRRDNIVILAPQRLDDEIMKLDAEIQELRKNKQFALPIDELLSPDLWKRPEAKFNPGPFTLLQMLCIVQKALEEEGDRATLTHEGARQLLVATDILPRGVKVPEWLFAGLASYFETPVGAPYVSIGSPNWNHAIAFKHFRKVRKLDDKDSTNKRTQLLLDVLSDRVFRKAMRMYEDLKDSKERDYDAYMAREEFDFARAASWSLTYYLIKDNQLDKLIKYRDELGKLPRDLPLDDKVLKRLFARAFNLEDKSGVAIFDDTALKTMARNWFEMIEAQPMEIAFVEQEGLRLREITVAPKKTPPPFPVGPGGPGGSGGPGGIFPPGMGPGPMGGPVMP